MPNPDVSRTAAPTHVNGGCVTCGEGPKRWLVEPAEASGAVPGEVPGIVHAVLRSSGQPLDQGARAFFEPRFGRDLSTVRVHSDTHAAQSARAIGALAYAAGTHIVTGPSPDRRLVAHELAHVVQQVSSPAPSGPVVRRQSLTERLGAWYEEKKWSIYRALINALKSAKNAAFNAARSRVRSLPAWAQSPVSTILDIAEFVGDLEIALCLAIIGLAVGFVEGLAGLVTGIVKLCYGLLKLVADLMLAATGQTEAFKDDLDAIANTVKSLYPSVKAHIGAWIERYKKANAEEQVLMGAEIVGAIEAFLATFAFAGAKAGQASARAGQVGAKSTAAADVVETAGSKATSAASDVAETAPKATTTVSDVAETAPKTTTPASDVAETAPKSAADTTASESVAEPPGQAADAEITPPKAAQAKSPASSPKTKVASGRPRLPRGGAKLSDESFRLLKEPLHDEALAKGQKEILQQIDKDPASATRLGNRYRDLIDQDLQPAAKPEVTPEGFGRPGRRPDIGTEYEVTLEGVRKGFSQHKLDQIWKDLRDNGRTSITVPKLHKLAESQLRRLGAQAEHELGRKVLIIVRETNP